ncbi:hypothetical protein CEB3_c40900 [Peptococcaceae bacterium CEB3]|nr:hypothetical protein CEB3_c40900 [Peptococcaceae bacterium CEB3]
MGPQGGWAQKTAGAKDSRSKRPAGPKITAGAKNRRHPKNVPSCRRASRKAPRRLTSQVVHARIQDIGGRWLLRCPKEGATAAGDKVGAGGNVKEPAFFWKPPSRSDVSRRSLRTSEFHTGRSHRVGRIAAIICGRRESRPKRDRLGGL